MKKYIALKLLKNVIESSVIKYRQKTKAMIDPTRIMSQAMSLLIFTEMIPLERKKIIHMPMIKSLSRIFS